VSSFYGLVSAVTFKAAVAAASAFLFLVREATQTTVM